MQYSLGIFFNTGPKRILDGADIHAAVALLTEATGARLIGNKAHGLLTGGAISVEAVGVVGATKLSRAFVPSVRAGIMFAARMALLLFTVVL